VWLSYDYKKESGLIEGLDPDTVYMHLYLAILSRVGERLDGAGLHRVHALGLSGPGGGCLFLMPPGGGKSSLGVSLLGLPGWRLLSEDTPLLDRRGYLHPFPFRIGLRDADLAQAASSDQLRSIAGKLLVRADAYPLQNEPVPCRHLFAGAWTTGSRPRIQPLRKSAALALLVRDCVVGLGLPQIAELFLRLTPADVLRKTRIALSRLVCASILAGRAECHRIYLCPDPGENARFLSDYLEPRQR
jgi:hypothetical protein